MKTKKRTLFKKVMLNSSIGYANKLIESEGNIVITESDYLKDIFVNFLKNSLG